MEGRVLALCLIKSVIFCSVTNIFRSLRYITHDDSYIKDEEEEDETACHNRERDMLSIEDAMVVMEILGMGEWRGEERWREGVGELLEEKEASTEEVKEAFCVFDRNKDGYITPAELWSVMRG